ncbi:MAG TPA: hypothetical protein VL025_14060 [Thermoanaerobaculia bacterium]|nr:hypothetical protein [Thermoanaerobaculia bacterium]
MSARKKKTYRGLLIAVPAVLLLLAPAAPAHAAGSGGLGSLWAWLTSWIGLSGATGQGDSGPMIDPFGNPLSGVTGQGDQGPTIDPNGGGR